MCVGENPPPWPISKQIHMPPRDRDTYCLDLLSLEVDFPVPSIQEILASVSATHLTRSCLSDGLVALACWHDVFISGTKAQRRQAWEEFVDHDTMGTMLHIVLDDYLCGFSKDELIRSVKGDVDADRTNAYMTAAIQALQMGLACCASALKDDPTFAFASQIRHVSRLAYSQLHSLWQRLWEIKEPFLDSQLDIKGGSYEEVWLVIVLLAEEAMIFQYESGETFVAESRLPHLAVALWIHRPRMHKDEVCSVLLHIWNHARHDPKSGVPATYAKFYEEILAESTITAGDISRALTRDFKTMKGAETTEKLLDALNGLRPCHDTAFDMRTRLQREVLYRSVAACRECLCSEDGGADFHHLKAVFSLQLVFVIKSLLCPNNFTALLSERHIHSIIALVNAFMVDAMDERNCTYVSYCSEVVSICRARLRQLFPDGDQSADRDIELDAIRRRTYIDWQRNLERMYARGYNSEYYWTRVVLDWKVLGMVLDRLVDHRKSLEPVFAPLTRCAWKGCLCNVHAPSHKMRSCKGCQRVAYCGVECQEKDWKIGAHKTQCRTIELDI